ncbi:MAG: divalent-cation tolerance protein CutA [Calditrichota bacterium]
MTAREVMENGNGERLVLTTFDDAEHAAEFARGLVAARLAACATLIPGGRSFYRYQSAEIRDDAELLLLIKTHRDRLTALEAYFRTHHPYDCPELIVLEISALAEPYRDWLRKELQLDVDPSQH